MVLDLIKEAFHDDDQNFILKLSIYILFNKLILYLKKIVKFKKSIEN